MTALRTAAPAHAAPTQLTPFKAVSLWIKRSRYLGLHRADEYDALHEWEHHTADFLVRVAEQQFLDAPVPDEFIRLQGEMVARGYCDDTIREAILHAHRHGSLECFELDEDSECDRAALEASLPDAWDPPWLPGHESGFVGEWIVTETDSSVATLEPPAEPELLTKPSYWLDGVLWWRIGGRHISDADLRSWCYQHMPYPSNHVDVVRKYHVDAWAKAHGVALAAAISAPPDDAAARKP